MFLNSFSFFPSLSHTHRERGQDTRHESSCDVAIADANEGCISGLFSTLFGPREKERERERIERERRREKRKIVAYSRCRINSRQTVPCRFYFSRTRERRPNKRVCVLWVSARRKTIYQFEPIFLNGTNLIEYSALIINFIHSFIFQLFNEEKHHGCHVQFRKWLLSYSRAVPLFLSLSPDRKAIRLKLVNVSDNILQRLLFISLERRRTEYRSYSFSWRVGPQQSDLLDDVDDSSRDNRKCWTRTH